ncbi:MAG: S16 family serine protease [Candidatus Nanopelagicales bacterium]
MTDATGGPADPTERRADLTERRADLTERRADQSVVPADQPVSGAQHSADVDPDTPDIAPPIDSASAAVPESEPEPDNLPAPDDVPAPAPAPDNVPAPAPAPTVPDPPDGLGSTPGIQRLGWWERVTLWWGGTPPRTRREHTRARAMRRGVIAGGLFIAFGSVAQLPLLVFSPGPLYNTIGEVGGQPLITISGTTTYPTAGQLDMTTISERGGSSGGVFLGEALVGWASPARAVVPREAFYPPEVSGAEVSERNDQLFALSQSDSISAAMNELGIPTTRAVVVTVVGGGTPADGIVEAGDQIVKVDGESVSSAADVGELVRQRSVGDSVELEVLRRPEPGADPEKVTLEVVTQANPDLQPDPSADPEAPPDTAPGEAPGEAPDEAPHEAPQPYLGIVVGVAYEPPFDIEFADSNVGGPSAGMMFSLAIVDMLTDGYLNGGGHVAGTGSIDPEGNVGPIGGIQQKLVGAQRAGAGLFLAPENNCDEVVGHVPDGLTVVPVATLDQARATVEKWVQTPDAQFPQCGQGIAATSQ